MTISHRRWWLTLLLICAFGGRLAWADPASDCVRIHLEAIGGEAHIAALKSLRAAGEVVAGGRKMKFTLLAARPNQVRLETDDGKRTLVQATDGKNPPWEFDTGQWPPRYHDMAAAVAKTFVADAEFDDPLVGGQARGFTFDYAGEVDSDGGKLIRLLVTRDLSETFALLLDPKTYFIVKRIDERKNPLGGTAHVVTFYGDYRPVADVLIPHEITLVIDGRPIQQTRVESVEANPEIATDAFTRTAAPGAK